MGPNLTVTVDQALEFFAIREFFHARRLPLATLYGTSGIHE
jgi:hypothetical protein